MHKMSHNQKGFGLLGILLAIVVLVAVIAGGAYIHNKNNSKTAKTSTAHQGNSSTSKVQNTLTPNTNPNPYENWKTYCDTTHHYCFKYPTNWTLDTSSTQVTVLNVSKSVEVDYIYPYVHDSGLLSFDPVSIQNIAVTGLNLKIVGGVYLPANEPDYGVIDASLLTTYPLTVGQTTNFPGALRFTDTHSSNSNAVEFRARATSQMSSHSDAQEWFNTSDAGISLKILESLSYQSN